MDASTIATTSTDKMKQIESIEYNISLFEELTFMQRNIIRYNFRKLIDEILALKSVILKILFQFIQITKFHIIN